MNAICKCPKGLCGCNHSAPKELQFMIPRFIEMMQEIGRYGWEKYKEDSFEYRALTNNRERHIPRTQKLAIAKHACTHIGDYVNGTPHDRFGTLGHQLAAGAFNLMMEFYFANLEGEQPLCIDEGCPHYGTPHVCVEPSK